MTALIISIASIVVAAGVALYIAAMSRKQMRQVELHRMDPSVSLIPPPHPATRFLKRYRVFVAGIVINLIVLIVESFRSGPITRVQVLNIVVPTVAMGVFFVLFLIAKLFDQIIEVFRSAWDASRKEPDKAVEKMK